MTLDLIPWKRNKSDKPVKADVLEEHPITRLHQEMDTLFERFFDNFEGLFKWPDLGRLEAFEAGGPRIDVADGKKELRISAELPGLDREDVDLTIDEHHLVLQGEKKFEQQDEKDEVFLSERSYGRFYRSIPLPEGLDLEKADASFKKGVLTIRFPKLKSAKSEPKKINITS